MVDAKEIVIVASAFGMDAVRAGGHLKWAQASRRAGAAGFEVRRELFEDEADAAPRRLRSLGAALADLGLWTVYSTPASLFTDHGQLDVAALRLALDEADALGARIVKLQLGGFRPDPADTSSSSHQAACWPSDSLDASSNLNAAVAAIAEQTAGAPARLVVENGQLAQGGSLAQFVGLFGGLARAGRGDLLGMTFDIGNWAWRDVAPLDAACLLAPHVEYIHCKTTVGEGARRFPAAPAADDSRFRAVLDHLPGHVPRGIEFPFDARRLDADAAHFVEWLAAL